MMCGCCMAWVQDGKVPVGCKGKSSGNPDGKEGHRAGEWGRGWMGDGPLEAGTERKGQGVLGGCVGARIFADLESQAEESVLGRSG